MDASFDPGGTPCRSFEASQWRPARVRHFRAFRLLPNLGNIGLQRHKLGIFRGVSRRASCMGDEEGACGGALTRSNVRRPIQALHGLSVLRHLRSLEFTLGRCLRSNLHRSSTSRYSESTPYQNSARCAGTKLPIPAGRREHGGVEMVGTGFLGAGLTVVVAEILVTIGIVLAISRIGKKEGTSSNASSGGSVVLTCTQAPRSSSWGWPAMVLPGSHRKGVHPTKAVLSNNKTGLNTRIDNCEPNNFSCVMHHVSHASLTNFKLAAERGLITHLNGRGCL